MNWKRKIALGMVIILGLYSLIGFVLLPGAAGIFVPPRLSAALDRPVSVGNIAFNPFALTLTVEGLTIGEPVEPEVFAAFESLFIDVDLRSAVTGGLIIKALRLKRPYLRIVRQPDNAFNFSDLLAARGDEESQPVETDTGGELLRFALGQVQVIEGEIVFYDQVVNASHRFAPLDFELPSISSFEGDINLFATPRLTGKINDTDIAVSIRTKPFIDSLETIAAIDINGLRLAHYFPYAPENTGFELTEGRLDIQSNVSLKRDADQQLTLEVSGRAALSGLEIINGQNDVLFSLAGLEIVLEPSAPLGKNIHLSSIAIDKPHISIVRHADGALNLHALFGQEDETAETADAPKGSSAPPFNLAIQEIRFNDLSVDFTDRHITPNFSTRLDLYEGSIKGLSSESTESADLSIRGALDRQARIDISGRIHPLPAQPAADIAFLLEDLALSPLSPYSGTYIGNAIEKGKLHLDLAYLVEGRQLQAQNRILLDQFTLGHRVDSPDALNLPVGLAVALLKDRSGRILLDIPVSGRTDDPQFSVSNVITQSLMNLLTRAATSPFALVGRLVGGGEELRYIEFGYGFAALDEQAQEKLSAVEEILFQRPELSLEIAGYVDVEGDRAALKNRILENELRSLKLEDMAAEQESDHIDLAAVTLSEEEYSLYLQRLHELWVPDVPDAPDGDSEAEPTGGLTEEEMAAAIRERIPVTDVSFGLLKQKRVQAAKDYILAKARIESGRLFVLETQSPAPEEATAEYAASRVELGLK